MKANKKSRHSQFWKLMRIGALQTMLIILFCATAIAHDNIAQLLNKKVSLSLTNVTFEKALLDLSLAADIRFAYSIDQLDVRTNISIQVHQRKLSEVLDQLLSPHDIQYKVHETDSTISLKRKPQNNGEQPRLHNMSTPPPPSLPLVTGLVTDINKQPLAGVNIVVKGSTNGTTTGNDGRYTLAADNNDVLVFSFIGFATQEVTVSSQTVIDITLIEDIKSLTEVVVNAGYWEVAKKENTGSITRVTAAEIDKQPVANPLQSLQGRMAGVSITPSTGIAGGAVNIQIRGRNSLRPDGNYPLYIIDGVPIDSRPSTSFSEVFFKGVDPINTINPANIESIEILKDADATAIYGSRGANGVVLITTKKAKQGASSMDIQMYQGWGNVSQRMNLLTTDQYLPMRYEAMKNDGWLPYLENPAFDNFFPDLKIWSQENNDWQEALLGGTANISDGQLSYSAGNSNTSFRLGSGIHRETTVFPGAFSYLKATAHFNMNHTAVDNRLRLSLSLNYGRDNNDLFSRNIVYDALTLPPNAASLSEAGDIDWTGYDANRPNPYSYLKVKHNNRSANLISNAIVAFDITSAWNAKVNLGFTDTRSTELIATPRTSMPPASTAPRRTTFGNIDATSWIIEPQISYDKELGPGHLTAMAGMTWQSRSSSSQWIAGSGYVSDDLLENINAAAQINNLGAENVLYRYNAAFARIAYQLNEKYFLNLTGRRDGSSRFGHDNQYANFASLGTAWIFSRENFASPINYWLSFGKLRASIGTTGSDQIADYGYLSKFNASPFTYQGNSILLPTAPANPNFAWEINRKLETALELGFLDDKLTLTLNWYNNRSSNQLVGYTLPTITGFSSVQANLAATVENTGFEIEWSADILSRNNLKWTTALNITLPKNKLVSYPGLESSSYATKYKVGHPLTVMTLYQLEGVDPATGTYQFTDFNDNNNIDLTDQQFFLNTGRKMYGGWNNTVSLGQWQLGILMDFVKQSALDYRSTFLEAPGRMTNQSASILDQQRWQNPGDAATVQKYTVSNTSYEKLRLSNAGISDASFARFRTLSLSYNLDTKLIQRMKLNNASIYLQAQNLWTLSTYEGLDPEMPGTPQLPQLRVITTGIKLQF